MDDLNERAAVGSSSDSGGYDLAPESPPRSPMRATKPPIAEAIPISANHGGANNVKSLADDTERIKNVQMPLWLLAGGIVIEGVAAVVRERGLSGVVINAVLEPLVGTALMLVAILLVAWLRKISFGPFPLAVLKLAAISVAPGAVVTLLNPLLNVIPFGGLVGLGVAFVLYFALLGALFDLDESDTWYCIGVIFLVHLAIYFLRLWVLHF